MFGSNQISVDPRDGLILFGPHERFNTKNQTLRAGVIGTEKGIKAYKDFVKELNKPLISTKWSYQSKAHESDELQRPSFPGFEAVFNVHWSSEPELEVLINPIDIFQILKSVKVKKKRTNDLVELYLKKILETKVAEDSSVDIWFVIVPKEIWENCRPNSKGSDISKGTIEFLEKSKAGQMSLFADDSDFIEELQQIVNSSSDFHHLLKARLIQEEVEPPIQIFVEPKLQFRDILSNVQYPPNLKAHFAWTVSTTVYYKLGKLPWKLTSIRDGVCYLGLVFKKLNDKTNNSVCSAAQMFLKDGDGAVFRGNIGLWESKPNEFHLDEKEAENLLEMALSDYFNKWNKYPEELFIHGRVEFDEIEWKGFENAIQKKNANTNLVGVVIKDKAPMKLFREAQNQPNRYGVLRGIGIIINEKEGYLNTRGFVPRLNTSLSIEIPNTLFIRVARGNKDIETVMADVLALTKLNYNACIYADGKPVTLSFSDNIGSILTATDQWKVETRQFKYYI